MNKNKIPMIPIACLVGIVIVMAFLILGQNDLIINYSIKIYRAACLVVGIAIIICAVWTVIGFMVLSREAKIREETEREARLEQMGLGKKTLDESDRQKIYQELKDFADTKWRNMDGIRRILRQFDSMNEYQAEMGRLLNQDVYLKNKPAEIVQRVEDCMYINARKLLNYMRIIQVKDPAVMESKIVECEGKNADLLKKTDDFVVAVVTYINRDMADGEEEKTRDSVDAYMYVVLDAIELPETYLK